MKVHGYTVQKRRRDAEAVHRPCDHIQGQGVHEVER